MNHEEIKDAMLAIVDKGITESTHPEYDANIIAAWLEFVADYDTYDIFFGKLGFDHTRRIKKKFTTFRDWIDTLK